MPISWQKRHIHATVSAGRDVYQAQAPFMLALGPVRKGLNDAQRDADAFDRMFPLQNDKQRGAVAQAMQASYRNDCMTIGRDI